MAQIPSKLFTNAGATSRVAQSIRAGKCAVCGKDKSNLSDHHVLDFEGKKTGVKLVICRDCHDVLEQYRQALERLRKATSPASSQSAESKKGIPS